MNAIAPIIACGRRRTRDGFTLVEILATLTFIAIVLPTVMNGISLCLAATGYARAQTEAASLAQTKMDELLAGGQWETADLAGDFGEDWSDYHWAAQLNDWDGAALRSMDVTVTWTQRGKQREVVLTTLVYTGVPYE